MKPFPHDYDADADGKSSGTISVSSDGLPDLETAAPIHFDGPGDRWSPEHLLVASIADCFILTFRAIARHSKLPWEDLHVHVHGVLDRVERRTLFTRFDIAVELTVPEGVDEHGATRLLEKAEETCLITNSLKSEIELATTIKRSGGALS